MNTKRLMAISFAFVCLALPQNSFSQGPTPTPSPVPSASAKVNWLKRCIVMPETPENTALKRELKAKLKAEGKKYPKIKVRVDGVMTERDLPICCTLCFRRMENPNSAVAKQYVRNMQKRIDNGGSNGSL